jgi:type II secretory pathway predicted ATPase ExeA
MYTTFYGLADLPFELNPNPKYLLLTPRHREALANLEYGISARKSLTLLLGEAGTGKTTLVRAAVQSIQGRRARILLLSNPVLSREEFVQFLADSFGLGPEAAESKAVLLRELERELLRRSGQGETTALVIDEAQSLSHELLEEIRLLANIETNSEKLLPLVLVGQPELAERLNHVSLRQLKQRIALRCMLGLLDLVETSAYIAGRIRIAGGDCAQIFTREAVMAIHQRSAGVPRTISVICDNALVNGFAAGVKPIGPDIVRDVAETFDLGPVSLPPGAPCVLPPTAGGTVAGDDRPDLFAGFSRRRGFSFF